MNSTIVQTIYTPYSLSIPQKVLRRVFGGNPKESNEENCTPDKMVAAFLELEKHVFHKTPIGILVARKVINHNGTGIYIGYASVDEIDTFNYKRGKEIANSRIDFLVENNPNVAREFTPHQEDVKLLMDNLDGFVVRAKKYFNFDKDCDFIIFPCFVGSPETMSEMKKDETDSPEAVGAVATV